VKVKLNQKDDLKRELQVEVPADTVESEINTKLNDFRKQSTIKGFRKGKAPMNMIRSLYGDEARAMVADELIKSTLNDAVKEKELRIAGPPTLTALDFNEAGDLVYSAEVEVFPELGEVSYNDLEITKETVELKDEEVEEIVGFYRQRFSDLREVNRPAKDDDVVIVDLAKVDDPRGIMPQDQFVDVEIDLAKGMTVTEFKEQMPGMSAGEVKEIRVEYAEDYPDERFAGANITYSARVKAVKERILPEFDDALAKRSGQAETALELKLKIRQDLENEKQDVARNKTRGQLIEQVCKQNPIPIPDSLVEEYLNAMVQDYKKQFPGTPEEEIRENYRENAVNSIRWNLLYHKLAEQEKIEVSPADTENWIEGFAKANNVTVEQAKQALSQSGRSASIRDSLLEQKVLDFLGDKARTVETK
jgi:trigger factor